MTGPAESMPVDVKSAGPDADNGAPESNQGQSGRSKHPPSTPRAVAGRPGRPVTLLLGLGLIIVCEALLAIDVTRREAAVLKSEADVSLLPAPDSALQHLARRVAIDMTPLCWVGYLLVTYRQLCRVGLAKSLVDPPTESYDRPKDHLRALDSGRHNRQE